MIFVTIVHYVRITGFCYHFQLPHFRFNPSLVHTSARIPATTYISNPLMETQGFIYRITLFSDMENLTSSHWGHFYVLFLDCFRQ